MPVGIQRLNAKRSQPNPQIVFIKPLKGPDEKVAQDFLERIAAQCLPIMRDHHLNVMSLEEYEPNLEFVGRNFNAGEVIQLVLKSPRSGRWLPFDYVQMVMMHELAHCKQMNHSKFFWQVRNTYAQEMRALWSKGYTGDGLWGRGTLLATGEWSHNTILPEETLPEHLCGGTYRSRRRKRKTKPVLSYQERKERRILKKFGANGVALGADEDEKVKLEKGKRVQAKPRVAGSARGRELRAAAALARFEKQKVDEEEGSIKAESSDTEGEYEEEDVVDGSDALDIDGTRIVDASGKGMVKVCGDAEDDDESRNEVRELRAAMRPAKPRMAQQSLSSAIKTEVADEGPSLHSIPHGSKSPTKAEVSAATSSQNRRGRIEAPSLQGETCGMCSFQNPALAVTCGMCANVLLPDSVQWWRCSSSSCQNSSYRNALDCGVCGLCGSKRPGDIMT